MNEFEIRTRVKFLNESRKREPARCRAASDTELVTGSGAPGTLAPASRDEAGMQMAVPAAMDAIELVD